MGWRIAVLWWRGRWRWDIDLEIGDDLVCELSAIRGSEGREVLDLETPI